MFFLCDNEDGRVYDISENCFKTIGLNINYVTANELNTEKSHITMKDICTELDLTNLAQKGKK